MSEMVERMAEAASAHDHWIWEKLHETERDWWRDIMRVAIRALREPIPQKMRDAGGNVILYNARGDAPLLHSRTVAEVIFIAMIDAALK